MKPNYRDNDPRGWCGDPRRGAAMGRGSRHVEPSFDGRLFLERVRLNQGGYDRLGTYFGSGDPLYWCCSEDGSIDYCLRASSRTEARATVLKRYPAARVRP